MRSVKVLIHTVYATHTTTTFETPTREGDGKRGPLTAPVPASATRRLFLVEAAAVSRENSPTVLAEPILSLRLPFFYDCW